MRKKVLYIITKSNWGGAQRYVFDLATSLPKDEFEAVAALGGTGKADTEPGALKEKLAEAGVRTIFVPSFVRDVSLTREHSALRELISIIKKEKPDIVHLNSSKAGGVGALAARIMGVKNIVFTSHGLAWDEDRNPFARMLIYLATWGTFLLCDKVIVISRDTYKRARALPFCRNKVHLVHNGVRTLAFMSREESRLALNLPPGKLIIGAIGELTWNKNYHTLIRTMGELKRAGKEFFLCIIGDGEERTFLHTLVEEHDVADRVHFAGFIPQAYAHLKTFDIFALPSLKEGLPYVLLEAGQAGLPVVAARIPGVIDIIEDGESGLLALPKDERALARAFSALIDDPAMRDKLSRNLQKKMAGEFSIANMVEATSSLYRKES